MFWVENTKIYLQYGLTRFTLFLLLIVPCDLAAFLKNGTTIILFQRDDSTPAFKTYPNNIWEKKESIDKQEESKLEALVEY